MTSDLFTENQNPFLVHEKYMNCFVLLIIGPQVVLKMFQISSP